MQGVVGLSAVGLHPHPKVKKSYLSRNAWEGYAIESESLVGEKGGSFEDSTQVTRDTCNPV